MIIRDIIGDRRVRPSGHDYSQPDRRPDRQQGSDAVGIRAGRHPSVLIQPVDHQHQPLAFLQPPRRAGPAGDARGPTRPGRLAPACPVGRPAAPSLRSERPPVILALVPGGDEERHHLHARRRVQHEPRHQRGLACPGRRPPPRIRTPLRLGAERCQLRQLLSRSCNCAGAICRTCSRYAERTTGPASRYNVLRA